MNITIDCCHILYLFHTLCNLGNFNLQMSALQQEIITSKQLVASRTFLYLGT